MTAHHKEKKHQFAHAHKKKLKTKVKSPLFLAIISTLMLVVFFRWLIITLFPVFAVETKYQYTRFLIDVMHVTSLKELFVPDFSGLDLTGRSKYKEYGIKIPKAFIDEPVVFNVDPNDKVAYKDALKNGIAHASSTAFPDTAGVGYYFAHSSSAELRTQYNAVFYLLGKLEKGDDVYIWHEGNKYHYLVTHSKVTEPDELNFLNQAYDQETIVLQTCWPPGTTRKRLLVFAEKEN